MMAVEVNGFAAAQARVSQLNGMFAQQATTANRPDGAAFSNSLSQADNRLEAINKAPATVERPYVYTPTTNAAPALKDGAEEVFAKAAEAARAASTPPPAPVTAPASAPASAARAAAVSEPGPMEMDGTTKADKLIATAKKYLGIPYKWGGTNPNVGLDCSGLVQLVYKQHGIDLPRVAKDQQKVGQKIDGIANARPGDLVYFGNPAHHVGIYVGDGQMLHAPRTGDVVKISKLHKDLTTIRRVLPDDAWTPPATAAATNVLASSRTGGPLAAAPAAYQQLFLAAEQKYGVSADLLAAVAKQESNFNPRAVSRAGARGLMQLMPGTARSLGVTDSFDPKQAVDGAARLLRDHLKTFSTVDLALAAYNAGPGAVRRYNGVPPYAETQNYVRKITANLATISGSRAA